LASAAVALLKGSAQKLATAAIATAVDNETPGKERGSKRMVWVLKKP
jgi:hypothetical protein